MCVKAKKVSLEELREDLSLIIKELENPQIPGITVLFREGTSFQTSNGRYHSTKRIVLATTNKANKSGDRMIPRKEVTRIFGKEVVGRLEKEFSTCGIVYIAKQVF
ncbi:MAG TPA: hypothetical protein P5060_04140 [Candidatus Absconditabacterales bacterium]|nr:hypothetical protein [Candidatus Absconditabacterales bacterium]